MVFSTEEQLVKEKMQKIGGMVELQLPKRFGYILLSYKHEADGGMMLYVSNSQRDDVVKAMKEFIEATENNYGNDTPKEGENNGK